MTATITVEWLARVSTPTHRNSLRSAIRHCSALHAGEPGTHSRAWLGAWLSDSRPGRMGAACSHWAIHSTNTRTCRLQVSRQLIEESAARSRLMLRVERGRWATGAGPTTHPRPFAILDLYSITSLCPRVSDKRVNPSWTPTWSSVSASQWRQRWSYGGTAQAVEMDGYPAAGQEHFS